MRSLSSMKDFEIFFRSALFRHRRRLEFHETVGNVTLERPSLTPEL